MSALVVIVSLGSVLANLAILGLCLKLYTEYFKDRAINARGKS